MVGPVNSNRPTHLPQMNPKQDAEAAPRGKSDMSIGHQAKAMLAEQGDAAGLDLSGANKMGKLASMLAQTKFDAETVPETPAEPEVSSDETPLVPVVPDTEPEEVVVELISESNTVSVVETEETADSLIDLVPDTDDGETTS